jgi:hypothetical protein
MRTPIKMKAFITWFDEWKKRSKLNNSSKEKQIELMKKIILLLFQEITK